MGNRAAWAAARVDKELRVQLRYPTVKHGSAEAARLRPTLSCLERFTALGPLCGIIRPPVSENPYGIDAARHHQPS